MSDRARRIQELIAVRNRIDSEIAALANDIEREQRLLSLAVRKKIRPACGTETGYTYHRRKSEPTCELCKAARALGERRRSKMRKMREAS